VTPGGRWRTSRACGTHNGAGTRLAEQERRERLWRGAAERFARENNAVAIDADFRVTELTVRRWRQTWRQGGAEIEGPMSRARARHPVLATSAPRRAPGSPHHAATLAGRMVERAASASSKS
jgi:hypothetical protein